MNEEKWEGDGVEWKQTEKNEDEGVKWVKTVDGCLRLMQERKRKLIKQALFIHLWTSYFLADGS